MKKYGFIKYIVCLIDNLIFFYLNIVRSGYDRIGVGDSWFMLVLLFVKICSYDVFFYFLKEVVIY